MAMNYSSCSFLVNDECAGMMRGCGCRSEEASPLSSCGVNSLWWDELELELELEEFDPVDLLPTDPFGMNLETTFTAAIASCIGDLTAMSGAGHFGSGGGDAVFADLSYYLNQAFALSSEPTIGGRVGVFDDPFGFGGLPGGLGADISAGLPPCASCSQFVGFVEDVSTSGNAALACHDPIDAVPGELPPRASSSQFIAFAEDASTSSNAALACHDPIDAVPGELPPCASSSQFIGFVEDASTSANSALSCDDTVDAALGELPPRASCSQFIGFVEEASISANAALACDDTVNAVLGELSPRASCSRFIGFVDDTSTSANAALACKDTVDAVLGELPPHASCSQFIGFVEDSSTSANAAFACDDTVDASLGELPPCASCSQLIDFMEDTSTSGNSALACTNTVDAVPDLEGSAPHEGMVFALGYLGLRDILSVEMVCKSLHLAVRSDPSLWKSIHIEPWLSKDISDADLLCLTRKSQGALQCLGIVGCINITDQGLKAVLDSNPRLTKLSIMGCARLTFDGFIANLKSFNMKAVHGIKNLRVGKLFSLPKEHYEELLSLMKIDRMQAVHSQEPQFFHANHILSDCTDGYALDIQMCPICQNYKPVYDCTAEGCDERKSGKCRACEVCILRCLRCGRCVENLEYEETFSFDCLCYYCQADPVPSLSEK